MWNVKYDTKLSQTNGQNRRVVAMGDGGGMEWEVGVGVSRWKLLYEQEWMNNKVLLYST